MQPQTAIQLRPYEILNDKPFTHPSHTKRDRKILEGMIDRTFGLLIEGDHSCRWPVFFSRTAKDGSSNQYVVPDPTALAAPRKLHVVGFFGQRRRGVPEDYFGETGEILIQNIPDHPGIAGYNMYRQACGRFSNLVLFSALSGKTRWASGSDHIRCIRKSPGYYRSARIYNGVLVEQELLLTSVKYYDFESENLWRGIRNF